MASSWATREKDCSRASGLRSRERRGRAGRCRPSSTTCRMSCRIRPSEGLTGESPGELVVRHVELHGGAEAALKQGVVEFLSDAGSFGETLFEAEVELRRHLQHA